MEEEEFLSVTRVVVALNKNVSYYLKKELHREDRQFLDELTNSVLSTVAARSSFGQEMSCFYPAILISGNDHALLQLFGLQLDRLLERWWLKSSEVGACGAEYDSFTQEQRLLDQSSTKSGPDVGNILAFCSTQVGFRTRRYLFRVCFVTNDVGHFCSMI